MPADIRVTDEASWYGFAPGWLLLYSYKMSHFELSGPDDVPFYQAIPLEAGRKARADMFNAQVRRLAVFDSSGDEDNFFQHEGRYEVDDLIIEVVHQEYLGDEHARLKLTRPYVEVDNTSDGNLRRVTWERQIDYQPGPNEIVPVDIDDLPFPPPESLERLRRKFKRPWPGKRSTALTIPPRNTGR